MLVIRMQRTGRKGYAQFRIVVQDSRQTPSSARVVASIGTYNPHTKEAKIDIEKAKLYIKNGSQPSERVVTLLKKEGVKLPDWVELPKKETKAIKNLEKLRKNRPAVKEEPAKAEPEAEKLEEVTETLPTEEVVEQVEPETKEQTEAEDDKDQKQVEAAEAKETK